MGIKSVTVTFKVTVTFYFEDSNDHNTSLHAQIWGADPEP